MIADIENIRTYWNLRPCNIRHSRLPVGTVAYFDEVERRKYFVEPHIPGFADFSRWNGKKVLEIGCGIGTEAVNFARAGADYTGLDLSEVSLDIARTRFRVFGLNGQLIQCNAEYLLDAVGPDSFDLVYSFGVLHHIPCPERVVDGIRKVIRADGELRVMLYARNSWKSIMIDEGLDQTEAQSGCPLARTYTPESAAALLQGFRMTSMQQDHIFPYVPEKYVHHEYEKQPWFAAMPDEVFRALERRLGWHLLIKAMPV